jgi:hypothetical protein
VLYNFIQRKKKTSLSPTNPISPQLKEREEEKTKVGWSSIRYNTIQRASNMCSGGWGGGGISSINKQKKQKMQLYTNYKKGAQKKRIKIKSRSGKKNNEKITPHYSASQKREQNPGSPIHASTRFSYFMAQSTTTIVGCCDASPPDSALHPPPLLFSPAFSALRRPRSRTLGPNNLFCSDRQPLHLPAPFPGNGGLTWHP